MTEILCVTHKYPPVIGGMEKQSFELIAGLKKRYNTHVIAYIDQGNKAIWFKNLKSVIKKKLADHLGISLILLNDGLMGSACLWLQKYTDIPVLCIYHGLDITFPSKAFQKMIIPRLSKYEGAICVSEATRQACLDRGFDPETTYTVLNGVDKDMSEVPIDQHFDQILKEKYNIDTTGKRIIMTMGRPVKRKGFSWFLKNVMPALDPNIIFLMVGPLNEDPSLMEKMILNLPGSFGHNIQLMFGVTSDAPFVIEQVKQNDNVYHLGKVPYDELLQILSRAELFIMPNIKVHGDAEGFGLVALEASMRGTPVIAAGIEGITDAVIDGGNGITIASQDKDVWIKTIHDTLSDKEALGKMSDQTVQFTLDHYSWEKMTAGYMEVMERYV